MALTLIHHGTLIDGTGTGPVPDAALLVEDGRIVACGPASAVRASASGEEVREIDAGGGWIVPGFIDCHVHLMFEVDDLMRLLATPYSLTYYQAIDYMRKTLDAGVTTVRDAGGADLGVRTAVERGLVEGPRMQISITALTTTGGHLDFWLPSGQSLELLPETPGRPDPICDGIEGVRRKVREVLRAGADWVKVCSTGGVMSPTDHPRFTQFTQEELEVMVQEGGFRGGVPVMAHAQGAEGIKNAVRAGIRSIEHGIYLDDEAIELMLEHGTWLVPTLVAPLGALEAAESKGTVPEWAVRKAREVVEAHGESIARAHRAGVRIAMGTDCGVAPHGTNLREIGLMVELAGLSPMEALVATTGDAARCLGLQDEIGTLEPGKRADVVVTSVDPLADPAGLADPDVIELVLREGRSVKDRLGAAVPA
ncbi:MAG: amidohydrolase family protein [Candidatus Palauibacterales bacterium]|nr:amidohydrolase family protein [Candidatus Palauibacterales bacterium]MDP2528460.1 amidohydrolase family protein [Candidatus Palauibacterales bacterium]MDP2584451.1 amidohydrolase family protein [Candidatus Palauibacterales bacterium]